MLLQVTGQNKVSQINNMLFSVGKTNRKEIFTSLVPVFFRFPGTAHDVPTYSRAYCGAEQLLLLILRLFGRHRVPTAGPFSLL